jgi:hypothetical protein
MSSAPVVVRQCRCHCPPLLLSSSAVTVVVIRHRCHPPPPSSTSQPSLPLRVPAVSCRPILSVPFVVRRPILHAVVVRCCCCPPLPSSSAAAVFLRCSHHHHSAVFTVSHCPLLSFPITVRRPITRVVVVRHRCHPPLPASAVLAAPRLVLPPTRC